MIDLNLLGAPAFSLAVRGEDVRYSALNRRLEALTGLRASDVVGRTPEECLAPAAAEILTARYRECLRSGEPVEYEATIPFPVGERTWQTTLTPVYAPGGQTISGLVGVTADITDRKRLERANREAQARAELALDVVEGGFWHYDPKTGTFETSRQLGRLLTGEDSVLDLVGYVAHIPPEDAGGADLSRLVEGTLEASTGEYRVRDQAGRVRWMRCKRRLLRDETGRPSRIVGLAFDITDQRIHEAELERDASTDPLTGILNRRAFEAATDRMLRAARLSGREVGLLMVDLDHFKRVNDRYGHLVGDRVLREAAAILKVQARPVDLVARLGGDEFVVVLDGCDANAIARVADRVSRALQLRLDVDGTEVSVTASVGGAFSEAGTTREDLLARADAALYTVKEGGRASWQLAA